jgi:hypothetical protein
MQSDSVRNMTCNGCAGCCYESGKLPLAEQVPRYPPVARDSDEASTAEMCRGADGIPGALRNQLGSSNSPVSLAELPVTDRIVLGLLVSEL